MLREKQTRDKHEWFNLGVARDKEADFKGAAEAYRRALQIDPNYINAWGNLGIAYHELGDYTAAAEAYRQALILRPNDGSIWFNLAFARYALNDVKGAIKACKRALTLVPGEADIMYTLACYYAVDGKSMEALILLEQAFILDPSLRDMAQLESDFNDLKEIPKFRELLGEIKKPQDQNHEMRGLKQKVASVVTKFKEANAYYKIAKILPKKQTPTPNPIGNVTFPDERNISYVQLKRQFEYIGGKVRIKVNVINSFSQGLLRLIVALNIPISFKLLRVEPSEYLRDGSTIKVGDLLPKEDKSVAWVLEPLICGKEKFGGTISGVDANGTPFAAPMTPLEVEIRCPLFIRPEDANLPTVQGILEDLPVHSERSFFLPEKFAPADAFELAKGVIAERDVRLVGTATGEAGHPYDKSAVFYGVTKVKQKRFVIIAAVSEADRAIRVSSACDEEDACTGFLAEAGASVRRELVSRGAYDTEEGVVELTCEKCGATLPRAPVMGRDVACLECRWTWRVTDFFR